jgi:hypothetical protein
MRLSEKSLKKTRAILLGITPEITAILEDIAKVNALRGKAGEISEEEAAGRGIEIVKEFISMLLVRQYDGIVRVLAALYEMPPEELEERPMLEIMAMIYDTLTDEALMRFFPRLRLLARKTPSDT